MLFGKYPRLAFIRITDTATEETPKPNNNPNPNPNPNNYHHPNDLINVAPHENKDLINHNESSPIVVWQRSSPCSY